MYKYYYCYSLLINFSQKLEGGGGCTICTKGGGVLGGVSHCVGDGISGAPTKGVTILELLTCKPVRNNDCQIIIHSPKGHTNSIIGTRYNAYGEGLG